jgi:flagellar biosynthesis/type III secretory pathway chaperone
MDDNFQLLAGILEQQVSVVGKLIELSGTETEALQNNDVKSLKAVLDHQQQPSEEMARLEEERRRIQDTIEEQLKMKDITLKHILQNAGPAEARLSLVGGELVDMLSQLQEINETNKLLIEQAISVENEIFKAVTGVRESYNQKGEKVRTPGVAPEALNKSV